MISDMGQSEDERVLMITVTTNTCAHEYSHAGDPQRRCHVGLERMIEAICAHCVHRRMGNVKRVAAFTGESLARILEVLRQAKSESVVAGG